MTFGTAEFEDTGVVADKGYAFGGVAGLGAEIACFDPRVILAVGDYKVSSGSKHLMVAKMGGRTV